MMGVNMSVTTLTIGTLLVLVIGLGGWVVVLHRRINKLVAGKNGQSLEEVIGAIGADVRALEGFRDHTLSTIARHEERIRRSIQGVETVRFNAFRGNGEGGNQSFAVALLSEDGSGTVVSSLYARDRVSVFAKPVKNFSSEHGLTEEEKEAISRATPR